MKFSLTLSLALFLAFSACTDAETDTTPLHGEWQAASWTVNGEPTNRAASGVAFVFNPDRTYTASMGQQSESGSYRLSGDKLYTTADGQIEKMVKITQPHPDTLVMDMNRVGTPEVIRLVRRP